MGREGDRGPDDERRARVALALVGEPGAPDRRQEEPPEREGRKRAPRRERVPEQSR